MFYIIYIKIATYSPTTSNNIIYVRDYGCDYGYCYNIDGDYNFNCKYNSWLNNSNNTQEYQYCCFTSQPTTFRPTITSSMYL